MGQSFKRKVFYIPGYDPVGIASSIGQNPRSRQPSAAMTSILPGKPGRGDMAGLSTARLTADQHGRISKS